jgi:uncharacterized protein YbaP (TraB family)
MPYLNKGGSMLRFQQGQRWSRGWLLLLVLALTISCKKSSSNPGRPILWSIEGKKPSYLFGTIHFPDDRVLNLHSAVRDALGSADVVYAEIPMDSSTQMRLAMLAMLPDNKTLKDVLPADLFAKVEKLFKSKGIPMMALSRIKVWAIAVQVVLADHLMELATKTPLDRYIYEQAQEKGKETGGIETVEEQIAAFDSLTLEEQVQMLRDALEDREKNKEKGIDLLKVALELYLKGDEKKLMDRLLEEYDPEDPVSKKLIKLLFTDRNERMANRIIAKLKASPEKSFFFAVGTGHMPGEDGIVQRLRKAGHKVQRVVK